MCKAHKTQNTKNTSRKKNIDTMISPNPPAPSGFIFKGECDRRMSRDRSQSPQHGDAIFIRETNCFFILLPIILCASAQRARGQKVSF